MLIISFFPGVSQELTVIAVEKYFAVGVVSGKLAQVEERDRDGDDIRRVLDQVEELVDETEIALFEAVNVLSPELLGVAGPPHQHLGFELLFVLLEVGEDLQSAVTL